MTVKINPKSSIAQERERVMSHIRRDRIFAEISDERTYQDRKWGGSAEDDKRSTADFVGWLVEYAVGASERAARHDVRTRLVKAAALAVAAIESIDRKAEAAADSRGEPVEAGQGERAADPSAETREWLDRNFPPLDDFKPSDMVGGA